jgi:cytochrome c oxidase subunit IV
MTHVTERTLRAAIAALLALTAGSFGLSYVHLGAATMPVALLIAGVKVGIVLLYFMHLVAASPTVRVMVLVVPVFVVLLVGFVYGDMVTR